MKRLVLILACSAALAAPAAAQTAYQAPRLSDGQPDLQGQWTNESSTKLERDPKYGARLVMTPDEVSREEAANTYPGVDIHDPFNTGLLDPMAWAHVMRVGGEPRTSSITSTSGTNDPASARCGSKPRAAPSGQRRSTRQSRIGVEQRAPLAGYRQPGGTGDVAVPSATTTIRSSSL